MFNWLKRDKHIHNFALWEVTHRFVGKGSGCVKIVQQRMCKDCGFTEIDTQEVF